jgi:hypothetical protein
MYVGAAPNPGRAALRPATANITLEIASVSRARCTAPVAGDTLVLDETEGSWSTFVGAYAVTVVRVGTKIGYDSVELGRLELWRTDSLHEHLPMGERTLPLAGATTLSFKSVAPGVTFANSPASRDPDEPGVQVGAME